jgi:DNA-binding beta-propeller fold protein YncE
MKKTLALLLLSTVAANAEMMVGLSGGKTLTWIDSDMKKVTGTVMVQGDAIAGFDVRPSDGKLYALTTAGNIVILDPKTGMTTAKSTLSEKLTMGVSYAVDFNPAADRLRILGSDGTSLRVNVEDGKATVDGTLKYAETDANKGKMPKVMAGAYTNSFAGTKETALFNIDMATGSLVKQAPPNDGILTTIGVIGAKLEGAAFDILSDGKGGNTAYILSGKGLHTVDLTSGSTKSWGDISGLTAPITDIAILPKM